MESTNNVENDEDDDEKVKYVSICDAARCDGGVWIYCDACGRVGCVDHYNDQFQNKLQNFGINKLTLDIINTLDFYICCDCIDGIIEPILSYKQYIKDLTDIHYGEGGRGDRRGERGARRE